MALPAQLAYYTGQGALTDPIEHRSLLARLPRDVAGLCRIIQGLLIHDHFGLRLYGSPPPALHLASRETLPLSERLSAIVAADAAQVTIPRPPFERPVGTCRDFALMLCGMLRQHSVPARVRCGFAKYFHPPSYEDHWVCEYWKAEEQRWAIADAQLDEAHRNHLAIDFDTADLPREQFLLPWQVWGSTRANTADPTQFGHGDVVGEWFLMVNLARDLLALRKREVSAWDSWRDAPARNRSLDHQAALRCDRIAALAEAAEGFGPPGGTGDRFESLLSQPPWQA